MKKLNEDTSKIEKEIMINKILDKLICNRGISKDKAIKKYLNGGIPDLYYPYLMKGMKQAGELILQKIKEKKRIRIIGDYDVDGVMSSYILHACLKRLGAICDVMIPHRIKDGYGLNGRLVCQSYLDGVDTIITCDNGITSITWVEIIKKLGMTVVITDHHDIQYSENKDGTREYILPPADVVINPKQPGCLYPFKGLCGAGVAWKLVCYLYEKAEIPREERYKFLEFVCLATVSDVMDLTDVNRILVKEGLKYLKNTENLGIRELISKNCLYQYNIDVDDIAFTLGPCLNASGRLDTAELSL